MQKTGRAPFFESKPGSQEKNDQSYQMIIMVIFILWYNLSINWERIMKRVLWVTGVVFVLFLVGVIFLLSRNNIIKLPSKVITNNVCPDGWQTYRQDILGIEFCYPPEWGQPKTDPVQNLTKLDGVVDELSKDESNAYNNSVFIGFSNESVTWPSLRFFNDKYKGEYYPNISATQYGPTDNISKLKSSGNICDYRIDFHTSYINTLKEIHKDCSNGIKTSLVENYENFDFIKKELYSYHLDAYAYKKFQNGYFDHLLIKYPFEYLSQNKQKLTSLDQFFNAPKDTNAQDEPMITEAQYRAQKIQFTQFVKSIKIFLPSPVIQKEFKPVTGENQDLTTIRQYYYYLANSQLQPAFDMHSEQLDFTKFQNQYKDVIKAEPRDFVDKGNGQYEFYVDYQENNNEPTVYHVVMEVSGGKIKTIVSEEITTSIISSGKYKAYAKIAGDKSYMVVLDGDKEIIADQGVANYNDDISNMLDVKKFGRPEFSEDSRYLYYEMYGWEWAISYVFDIENSKQVVQVEGSQNHGFTQNQKYFYACSDPGMSSGSGVVVSLPEGKIVYNLLQDSRTEGYGAYGCSYKPGDNFVTFELTNYYAQEGKPVQSDQTIKFSF